MADEQKEALKRTVLWMLVGFYMGVIFFLSSQPEPLGISLPNGLDKVVHLIEYAVLAVIVLLSCKASGVKHYEIVSVIWASIYGLIDEVHQFYVPGRTASAGDLVADIIGAFLGVFLYRLWKNR